MPNFSTPFNGNKHDRKLSNEELVRAIRFSIASEYEAIQLYDQIRESIDNKDAQKILEEISEDEKIHAGNFLYLLTILDPNEEGKYKEGIEEAKEIIDGI